MTRLELLKILVGKARTNGFEFRRWFTTRLAFPWENADAAFTTLEEHRHYYALLFSHDFAEAFWKAGEPITFQIPAASFERRMPDGSIATIHRKPFIRRSLRPNAWRYHLRQMALADEPLRYMRRYLRVAEEASEEDDKPPAEVRLSAPRERNVGPATLALAKKAHDRRLERASQGATKAAKRGARLPGSSKKTKST